jgi:hypothetical protein
MFQTLIKTNIGESIKENINRKFQEIIEEKKALDYRDFIDILVSTVERAIEEATREMLRREKITHEVRTEILEEFIDERYYEYQRVRKGQHFWGRRREKLTIVATFGTTSLRVNITYEVIVAQFDPHCYAIPTEFDDLVVSACEMIFP